MAQRVSYFVETVGADHGGSQLDRPDEVLNGPGNSRQALASLWR